MVLLTQWHFQKHLQARPNPIGLYLSPNNQFRKRLKRRKYRNKWKVEETRRYSTVPHRCEILPLNFISLNCWNLNRSCLTLPPDFHTTLVKWIHKKFILHHKLSHYQMETKHTCFHCFFHIWTEASTSSDFIKHFRFLYDSHEKFK